MLGIVGRSSVLWHARIGSFDYPQLIRLQVWSAQKPQTVPGHPVHCSFPPIMDDSFNPRNLRCFVLRTLQACTSHAITAEEEKASDVLYLCAYVNDDAYVAVL